MKETLQSIVNQTSADWGLIYSNNKSVSEGSWDLSDQEKIELLLKENISRRDSVVVCKNTESDRVFCRLKKINSFVCFPILYLGAATGAVFLGSKKINHFEENEIFWKNICNNPKWIKQENEKSLINFNSHSATIYMQGGLKFGNSKILGISNCMQEHVFEKIERYKNSNRILIEGETGTGKELVAEALYYKSNRKGNFVAINSKTLGGDTNIQLTSLFGAEKNWIPGVSEKEGYFLEANHGTLFLDEINSLSKETQAILLRALEKEEIEKCGSKGYSPIKIDLQVICSSNESLLELVNSGDFREDLYYRLAGCKIEIPPLRIRGSDDFKLIIHSVLEKENQKEREKRSNWQDILIKDKIMEEMITKSNWNGNVRQLVQTIRRSFLDSLGENEINKNIIFKIIEGEKIQANKTPLLFPLPNLKNFKELKGLVYKQAYEWLKKNPEKTQKDIAQMLGVTEETVSTKFKYFKTD